jgi:uncharacterized glyoxalase superfamily protein PhnB
MKEFPVMSGQTYPIPAGFTAVTPHLVVDGAAQAIGFYERAFGAEEVMRTPAPDGKRLMHAVIRIGGAVLMLADAFPEVGSHSPKAFGGSAVSIHLYVGDVDAVFDRAVREGAMVVMPAATMAWGDRCGRLVDPFGHHWSIATRVASPPSPSPPSPFDMLKSSQEAFANLMKLANPLK